MADLKVGPERAGVRRVRMLPRRHHQRVAAREVRIVGQIHDPGAHHGRELVAVVKVVDDIDDAVGGARVVAEEVIIGAVLDVGDGVTRGADVDLRAREADEGVERRHLGIGDVVERRRVAAKAEPFWLFSSPLR